MEALTGAILNSRKCGFGFTAKKSKRVSVQKEESEDSSRERERLEGTKKTSHAQEGQQSDLKRTKTCVAGHRRGRGATAGACGLRSSKRSMSGESAWATIVTFEDKKEGRYINRQAPEYKLRKSKKAQTGG